MNPTSTTEYDFKKDNAVIAVDHEAGFHDKDLPWVIYLSGVYVAAMDSFQRACEHAEKMGWLGHCTIRDVFAEQPTLGPMFGTGYESGYAAAKAEAADALSSLTRELEDLRHWLDELPTPAVILEGDQNEAARTGFSYACDAFMAELEQRLSTAPADKGSEGR